MLSAIPTDIITIGVIELMLFRKYTNTKDRLTEHSRDINGGISRRIDFSSNPRTRMAKAAD